MKIINGSNRVIMTPFGNSLLTIMPHNVSGDVVASRDLVRAIITSAKVNEVGIVTYSSAELSLINEISGAAPFIYDDLDTAITKLIPGGVEPVEQRVIQGGETVLVQTESSKNDEKKDTPEEIQTLVNSIEELKKKVSSLQAELSAEKSTNSQLNDTIQNLKLQLTDQQDAEELNKKVLDLQATNKNLEKLLSQSQDENAKLTESIETYKKDAAAALKKASTNDSAKDEEIAKLKAQISEQAAMLKSLEEKAANNDNSTDLESKLSEMEANLKEANVGLEKFRGLLNNTVKNNNLVWDAKKGYYVPAE